MPTTTVTASASGRKIGCKRACDSCKVRKVRCSGAVPCSCCLAAGVPCTFLRNPAVRGPKSLRARTMLLIAKTQEQQQQQHRQQQQQQQQRQQVEPDLGFQDRDLSSYDETALDGSSPAADSSLLPDNRAAAVLSSPSSMSPAPAVASGLVRKTPVQSLVLVLCIFRLRLFPLWPVVDIEGTMASLHHGGSNMEAYALANSVGAATAAQLKLAPADVGIDAAAMEAECQRARTALQQGDGSRELPMSVDTVRTSFFLHIYYENKAPGGMKSLLYLREAITLAQIMQLRHHGDGDGDGDGDGSHHHHQSPSSRERQMWQKIFALLYVTERGVAILHKLPAVLRFDVRQLDLDDADDATHVMPGFKKLVGLFWMLDQAGASDILQRASSSSFSPSSSSSSPSSSISDDDDREKRTNRTNNEDDPHGRLALLQQRLREVAVESTLDNDVQSADICVTRQWMQAVLWRASSSIRHRTRTDVTAGANANANSGAGVGVHLEQAMSLSHPVQIARRFLQAISRLPSSAVEAHGPTMEYKMFEMAKTVLDSAATGFAGHQDSLDMTRDVLVQLQKKLASYRGGNKTLLLLLHSRTLDMLNDSRVHEIRPVSSRNSPDDMTTYGGGLLLGSSRGQDLQRPTTLPNQIYSLQPQRTNVIRYGMANNYVNNNNQSFTSYHNAVSAPSHSQSQMSAIALSAGLHAMEQPFPSLEGPTTAVDLSLANSALWEPSGIWDLSVDGGQGAQSDGVDMMEFDSSSVN